MKPTLPAAVLTVALAGCSGGGSPPPATSFGASPTLPQPAGKALIPTINIAPAEGWPQGGKPTAAPGLTVTEFAGGLDHPRWIHVLPNGDVLVAESNAPPKPKEAKGGIREWVMGLVMKRAGAGVPSPDRITLLRDADRDGVAETRTVFLSGLTSPFGMSLIGDRLYIANADAVVRVPYVAGQTQGAAPEKVATLPAGLNHHWTKNILASPDGSKLYVTVGSNSNVGENGLEIEQNRAAVHELDLRAGTIRPFATGLRNPNGLAWEPTSGALWTVVNERDELGDDLVPDYLTSVKDGAFYGWPYSYWGGNVDARVKTPRPDLVARAVAPDYALGAHTASLGLAFANGSWPAPFASGAFVGQHGSWNRKAPSGYKVVFIPFAGGRPSGAPVDVLTGFLDTKGKALGRPVGVVMDAGGGLLVADDVGNKIWRVTAAR